MDVNMDVKMYEGIHQEIEEVKKLFSEEIEQSNSIIKEITQYVLGLKGKYIRPVLFLYCAKSVGVIRPVHIKVAVAIELLHTASLIHDDVLDGASIRRGRDTINRIYNNTFSVVFGDLLFTRIFNICNQINSKDINETFTSTAYNMCLGELLQMSHSFDFDISENEYIEMIKLKTASLFSLACKLGSIENSVNDDTKKRFENYGLNFGVAFQIVDDYLDIIGRDEVVGKSTGLDLDNGRPTLPILRLFQVFPVSEKAKLKRLISSNGNIADKKKLILDLIKKHKVEPYLYQIATTFINAAKSNLDGLEDNVCVRRLRLLADSIVDKNFGKIS